MIELRRISKADEDLKGWMAEHYSAPKGFVGRQLIYKVSCGAEVFGAIVAGSATRFLPGREDFFECDLPLNYIVNNTFFHIAPGESGYPLRNFSSTVVAEWRNRVAEDWAAQYGDPVFGWEALVELPRTGEVYRRDGWTEVGATKGYTCKRTGGRGTDSWTGKRVWDTTNLRPKRVFVRHL